MSILEFDQYLFDLTEFMKEDVDLVLKASDKFLHELFFVDRTNYFELKEADALLAEGHSRLTTPLLNLVMVMLAIFAVLGGDFSRKGYSKRIAWATGGAITVLIVQLVVQSAAADDPALNAAQWGFPISTIALLSYIYFARGRHLGGIERPQLDLLRKAGEAAS